MDDPIPGFDPTKQPQRVFKTQLVVCLILGVTAFSLFCLLRQRYPHIYAVRTLRKRSIRELPIDMFSWMKVLYDIDDEEVLNNSGLDAFVFIQFFKMGIKIFGTLAVFAVFVISPIRYWHTGQYDKEDIVFSILEEGEEFPNYLWVYPIFTYIFSVLVYYFLFDSTRIVLDTRQRYLGSQNSITDRTIKLDGIPSSLRDPANLKKHIEELGIGKVNEIKLIYDWSELSLLFKKRNRIIRQLEVSYANYLGLAVDIHHPQGPQVNPKHNFISLDTPPQPRPQKRLGKFGFRGPKQDKINYYTTQLQDINTQITKIRTKNFTQVSSAFITMGSVASAQMAAQAVLDPQVNKLIANLAPSPKDVKWENFFMPMYEKVVRRYFITLVIAITSIALVFPVSYLAAFLNIKTITKFWPTLGAIIDDNKWLSLFVVGLLPTYLFTFLNVCFPYFYSYLSTKQGYGSNGDIELSTVSKNFFYIFFNLFLVFTLAGTASNYWSLLSDTTKIAYQLATSLKKLSLFYVDLILLQGLGMFPFRLLQLGDVLIFNFNRFFYCQTPRDYRSVYFTPPIFNFGIQLPQPILILIITLIYSVISTKIVTSGLIYFILGYYTYKYQLMYTYVHPPHSTGKVWPMIFRRVCLGLVLFQLTMAGTLALEHAYILAGLIIPLFPLTLIVCYKFEKNYLPLSVFIALRSIKKDVAEDGILESGEESEDEVDIDIEENSMDRRIRKRRSTIDEQREQFTDYTYPYLTEELNGPWIGFDNDFVLMIDSNEEIIKKRLRVSEWE